MPIDLFSRSHRLFLLSLSSPRFRFDPSTGRLRLCVDRTRDLPPAWVRALRIEAVDELGGSLTKLDLEWEEIEDSLMTASCICPEVFRPRDLSHDFVPIGEVIFSAGAESCRMANGSSPARFAARKCTCDPDKDRL